ncbi:alpha/beta hydrolase [Agromyces endophyticus]|uniref:alpha/beta fold hydrolase n=1 Tax=Agromyces sp. H17E-10 TaxID=2932244 RepID=UPI001FD148BB|nr:alpha/beta hydrolase [Agromyces sp. H17E-10]UOQ90710.1 alpha/beta hydrolase [Agromyces sp. H17E-10]
MFEGFEEDVIELGETSVFVRHAGEGPPVVLLHGHPRTSATWHRVAPQLVAAGFQVFCPDLRGYGRSRGPSPTPDHTAHSKRASAGDIVAAMGRLGVERFHLVGHDRGSYVAMRLALDHPHAVDRLVLMDCVPISEHLARADARFATRWWHWFFFAQPDVPERVIGADPDAWYGPKADPEKMGAANHAELMQAVRRPGTIRAMLEDYRAGLTVDRDDELADRAAERRIEAPLLLLWALRDDLEELVGDPRDIWRTWAHRVEGHGIDAGHHQAEEAPDEVTEALRHFFATEGEH